MKTKLIAIFSAMVASACCFGPVILVALGLGGLGVGAMIGQYHWYFTLVAAVLLTLSWRSYFKQRKACDEKGCQMKGQKITKSTLIAASMVALIFVSMNIYTYSYGGTRQLTLQRGTQKSIPVKGMTCVSCELAIQSALKRNPGIYEAKASAKNQEVLVDYDLKKTSLDEIIRTIRKVGYKPQALEE